MKLLKDDITAFLEGKGFRCRFERICGLDVIHAGTAKGDERSILPLTASAPDLSCAAARAAEVLRAVEAVALKEGSRPILIPEDRWNRQRKMMEGRLLAHLEVFFPIYARNCEVRKIDRCTAAAFLAESHSYGDAASRYRYGLFLKRHTGHCRVEAIEKAHESGALSPGALVAVAEFSNARKWQKNDKTIRSYEWIRYASVPTVRITGGMGKVLRRFIQDVKPDDIMSYADLEWSEGDAYTQLGFVLEGQKEAATFEIDRNYNRKAIIWNGSAGCSDCDYRYYMNLGSNKYRLKLTEYE